MPEGAYKLTVIVFGLTNSPATFQTILNNLLRDMTETRNIVAFINNVIVGTEIEKKHDDIVKKVIRRMVENDLFVKSEKCVWKIREVGFLEVVIGLDGVKIEKEKVQEVVDWLVPRSMKNVQKFLGLVNYYRQFVKDFTRIVKSLYKMTRKDVKQNWEER